MKRDPHAAHARTGDHSTSQDAADHVTETTLKPSQRDVLAAMCRLGSCTQKDLEEDGLPYSPSRIRTAVSELVAMGEVMNTGRKEKLASGRRAIVWEPRAKQGDLFS